MFCPNCGAQNADNVPFCANCGSRIEGQAPAAPAYHAAPAYPSAPTYPNAPAYGAAPVAPAYGAAPATVPGKGLGIASMVVGIISLVLFCTTWIAMACAIVGAVLGGIAVKKAKDVGMKNGMAVAGLVCSIIALAIAAIVWIWAVVVVGEAMAMINSFL